MEHITLPKEHPFSRYSPPFPLSAICISLPISVDYKNEIGGKTENKDLTLDNDC